MAGVAVRSAIALGLNQRAIGSKIKSTSKETRCRIWWSIFSLEHQVSALTGRVSCLDYRSCRARPPSPIEIGCNREEKPHDGLVEEACSITTLYWTLYGTRIQLQRRLEWFQSLEPTRSLRFFHLVDLQLITHDVLNHVYSTDIYRDGWDEIATRMSTYDTKFDIWLHGLGRTFEFATANGAFQAQELSKDQVSLALNYFSAKIILHRPCQSRLKLGEAPNQLPPTSYRRKGALSCLRSALAIITILPDKPDMEWLHKMTPWLNILHFIMQAVTVLLIEITMKGSWEQTTVSHNFSDTILADPFDPTTPEIFVGIKKAICWLVQMADNDCSTQRALDICRKVILQFDPTNGCGLSDMYIHPWQNIGGETSADLPYQTSASKEQCSSPGWGP